MWISLVGFFITARNLLEGFLEVPHKVLPAAAFFAFSLFYVSVFLCLLIFLMLLTGWRGRRLLKFVAPAFGLIVLPPVVDWFVSGGEGYFLAYPILPPRQMLRAIPSLLGGVHGVTIGMRVEVALALAAVFVFLIRIVRLSWWRAALGALGVYAIICVHGLYPGLIARVSAPPRALGYSRPVPLQVPPMETRHALAVTFELLVLAWISRRKDVIAFVRQVRPAQAIFYSAMALWGAGLAYRVAPHLTQNIRSLSFDRFDVVALPLDEIPVRLALLGTTSLLAYWLAQVLNDRFDIDADLLNAQRNLFTGTALSRRAIWVSGAVAAALGLAGALSMGWLPFSFYSGAVLLAAAYSVPPFRLKRVPLLSAFTLSAICALMLLYGFTILPTYHMARLFPRGLLWILFLALPLGMQVKDLKDRAGDRATGTWSLPSLLGPVRAKRLLVLLVFVAFLIPVFVVSGKAVAGASAALALLCALAVGCLNARQAHGVCIGATVVMAVAIVGAAQF